MREFLANPHSEAAACVSATPLAGRATQDVLAALELRSLLSPPEATEVGPSSARVQQSASVSIVGLEDEAMALPDLDAQEAHGVAWSEFAGDADEHDDAFAEEQFDDLPRVATPETEVCAPLSPTLSLVCTSKR